MPGREHSIIERIHIAIGATFAIGCAALIALVALVRPAIFWPLYRYGEEFSIIVRHLFGASLVYACALAAIALLAPRYAFAARLVRPAAVSVSLVGSCVLVLAALEAFLYLKFKDVQVGSASTPSGYTFYRNYQTNSAGFRDLEREPSKPAGSFRIVALGDSVTFGSGVRSAADVYPQRLESLIRDVMPGTAIEVINAGTKGWNTEQEVEFMKEKGWDYSPDVLVLGYYLNDPETSEDKIEVSRAAEDALILPYPYGKFLYANSFTFYLATQRLNALLPSIFGYRFSWKDHNYVEHIHREASLAEHRRILEELIDDAERHDTPLLILLFPHMFAVKSDPYPYAPMHEHVHRTAAARGVPVLDLLEPLRASSIEDFTVSPFDGHPNEAVHELAAEQLMAKLEELHLLPVPDSQMR